MTQLKKTSKKQTFREETPSQDETEVSSVLQKFLGYCLKRTTMFYGNAFSKALEPLNLTPPHFGALSILANVGNVNQNSACFETGIDKASMVKIIDHLEKNGWVERVTSQEDRRNKNLHITAAGEKVRKKAEALRNQVEADFLAGLTQQEVKEFKRIIQKILDEHRSNRPS